MTSTSPLPLRRAACKGRVLSCELGELYGSGARLNILGHGNLGVRAGVLTASAEQIYARVASREKIDVAHASSS